MIVLCLWLLLTGGRGRLVVAGLFVFWFLFCFCFLPLSWFVVVDELNLCQPRIIKEFIIVWK